MHAGSGRLPVAHTVAGRLMRVGGPTYVSGPRPFVCDDARSLAGPGCLARKCPLMPGSLRRTKHLAETLLAPARSFGALASMAPGSQWRRCTAVRREPVRLPMEIGSRSRRRPVVSKGGRQCWWVVIAKGCSGSQTATRPEANFRRDISSPHNPRLAPELLVIRTFLLTVNGGRRGRRMIPADWKWI
jgi:hypothetical protein